MSSPFAKKYFRPHSNALSHQHFFTCASALPERPSRAASRRISAQPRASCAFSQGFGPCGWASAHQCQGGLSTVARGGASHARNARRWTSCRRQRSRRKAVSSADSQVLPSAELARSWSAELVRSLAGHSDNVAIDAGGAIRRCHHAQQHEQRFPLAESARLMPVIASPKLATSSANAGPISCKPAGATPGDTRRSFPPHVRAIARPIGRSRAIRRRRRTPRHGACPALASLELRTPPQRALSIARSPPAPTACRRRVRGSRGQGSRGCASRSRRNRAGSEQEESAPVASSLRGGSQ